MAINCVSTGHVTGWDRLVDQCADCAARSCGWLRRFVRARMQRQRLRAMVLLGALTATGSPGAFAIPCDEGARVPGVQEFYSEAWGIDLHSTRMQPKTRITAENVSTLKLAWSYGLGGGTSPRSLPLVSEDTIFIGDAARGVVALDRATGCERWVSNRAGAVASAIQYGRADDGAVTLYFTLRQTGVVAISATDGSERWIVEPRPHPVPMFSGTPLVYGNRIYVPISSIEIGLTSIPIYGCCTTSGGMLALDATTGRQVWHVSTIDQPPQVTGRHYLFVEEWGPSGAPVWGAPTLDTARGLLFFGTGQNYSHPTTDTSDAIFALDAATGKRRWLTQFTAGDAYNIACDLGGPNCPEPLGPDVDFGAPPVLVTTLSGRALLIAGQKSGDVHAMDPDTGKIIWQTKLGRGGALGGVHWGMAASEALNLVFVPVSDRNVGRMTGDGPANPGVHALDLDTGEKRWSYSRPPRCERCEAGFSAAITATPEVVFAGNLDGYFDALDARTGKRLWSADTLGEHSPVNSVAAKGGSFDAHGPMVAGDEVIVTSGYGTFFQSGGNALLVYRTEP